ncbi:MAG: hypothetical protein R3D28_19870 [Geminicoccaceae bacterium]
MTTTCQKAARRAADMAGDRATLATAALVVAVAVIGLFAGCWDMAVYTLSFWHYLVYALAFLWRHRPSASSATPSCPGTISLVALAGVCLAILPNLFFARRHGPPASRSMSRPTARSAPTGPITASELTAPAARADDRVPLPRSPRIRC